VPHRSCGVLRSDEFSRGHRVLPFHGRRATTASGDVVHGDALRLRQHMQQRRQLADGHSGQVPHEHSERCAVTVGPRDLDHSSQCLRPWLWRGGHAAQCESGNNCNPTLWTPGTCHSDGFPAVYFKITAVVPLPSPSPSPPPVSAAPSPTPQSTPQTIKLEMTASGDVADYTPAVKDEIKASAAANLGVPASDVTVTVLSASVIIRIEIATTSTASTAIMSTLQGSYRHERRPSPSLGGDCHAHYG
jgi:hypothetical protein